MVVIGCVLIDDSLCCVLFVVRWWLFLAGCWTFRCVVCWLLCGCGYVLLVVGCAIVLCIGCCVVVVISCLPIDVSLGCVLVVVWWWLLVACLLVFRCVVYWLLCGGGYVLLVVGYLVVLCMCRCVVMDISCLLINVSLCCV